MRALSRTTVGTFLVLARAASAQILPESSSKNTDDVDCSGLKLVAAAGVPSGPTRKYKFHGICNLVQSSANTGSFAGFQWEKDGSSQVVGSMWTDLGATWDSQTGDFKETAETQSPYAGRVSMVLRCAGDPVLTNVSCKGLGYSNTTGVGGFDYAYAVPRPISRGKTTLAEATALSQQQLTSGSNSPPPPPAPAPEPTILRSPAPTGTEPVAGAPPQIPVAPVRSSPSPTPPPPPESSGTTAIALDPAVQVELQDGRSLIADDGEGTLRWAMVGPNGQLMRRFPAGTRLSRQGHGDLILEWPGGSYRPGIGKVEGHPAKARHK